MCIAILNTPKQILSKQTLNNCWQNNSDGAGMLYIENNVLTSFKELTSFKKFYKHYKEAKARNKKSWFVLHFRISTHGKINETNCHPFMVNDNLGFVHNGIIQGVGQSNDFSDTFLFNQTILKSLPVGFEHNEGICRLVSEFIGYSKLIFLNSNNEWSIINEDSGHWADGNWFSNDTYKYVSDYLDFGGTKVKRGAYRTLDTKTWCDWCDASGATYNQREWATLCPKCSSWADGSKNSLTNQNKTDLSFDMEVMGGGSVNVWVSYQFGEAIVTNCDDGNTIMDFMKEDFPEIFEMGQHEVEDTIQRELDYYFQDNMTE